MLSNATNFTKTSLEKQTQGGTRKKRVHKLVFFKHVQQNDHPKNELLLPHHRVKLNDHSEIISFLLQNFTNLLLNRFESDNKSNTNSYTRYIEMAYSEVDQILVSDKQALIEIIRRLKTNKFKLKELETLKAKVNSSLNRLNEFEYKLLNIIKHDAQIQDTINKLENEINFNLLSLNNNLVKNNFTNNRNHILLSHFI